jgi:hypothetical protein
VTNGPHDAEQACNRGYDLEQKWQPLLDAERITHSGYPGVEPLDVAWLSVAEELGVHPVYLLIQVPDVLCEAREQSNMLRA